MSFDREKVKAAAAALARQGVFIGTSSWKYPGWRGLLYTDDRYVWRGRFSRARFDRYCLGEYAEVFKTVCVDAAYYKFPERAQLQMMVEQVPSDFLFALKVTDEITTKTFPNLSRFGPRAGRPNENFLNADLFASAFLSACEPVAANIGLLIFEFSQFHAADFARGRDFVEALDGFLGKLPPGWCYGVEIRNRNFLHPDYFGVLARHGVVHVYNNWTDMPPVSEQLALPGSRTRPDLRCARFLLKPGRRYEEAVKMFSPYNRLGEINADGREAAGRLIREVSSGGGRTRAFIYVNNRFEGCAPETIDAIIEAVRVP